jgi:hypothetical protein
MSMGSGWKTYLGVAILVIAIAAKIVGAEIPNVDGSTDLAALIGQALAFFGLRDKLAKL